MSFLYFLIDFTNILSRLSLKLQANDLLICDISREIETTMLELEELKIDGGGNMYRTFVANLSAEGELACGRMSSQRVKLTGCANCDVEDFQSFCRVIESSIVCLDDRFANLNHRMLGR